MDIIKDYQTASEVARFYNLSELDLKRRRRTRLGPPWERRNGRVRYRTIDVLCFKRWIHE